MSIEVEERYLDEVNEEFCEQSIINCREMGLKFRGRRGESGVKVLSEGIGGEIRVCSRWER